MTRKFRAGKVQVLAANLTLNQRVWFLFYSCSIYFFFISGLQCIIQNYLRSSPKAKHILPTRFHKVFEVDYVEITVAIAFTSVLSNEGIEPMDQKWVCL